MTTILLKPVELRSIAGRLREHAQRISNAMEQVDQELNALGSGVFSGERAGLLRSRYRSQRDRMHNAAKVIRRFADLLSQAADAFEKADQSQGSGRFPGITLPRPPFLPRIKFPEFPPRITILPYPPKFPGPFFPDLGGIWGPPTLRPVLPIVPGWLEKILRKDPPAVDSAPDASTVPSEPGSPNSGSAPAPAQPEAGSPGSGSNGGGGAGVTPVSEAPASLGPERLNKIQEALRRLDVENNLRYRRNRQGNNETYCNIFTMDYAKSMGAPLPEYLDWNHDGKPDKYLDANLAVKWLKGSYAPGGVSSGPQVGWSKVDPSNAAELASQGYVVVAGWENPGGIGHMAVVRPESQPGSIVIAQAGARNFSSGTVEQGFGAGKNVEYFVYKPADTST